MQRVLAVDDEAYILRIMQEFLTLKGYQAYTADNGLKAIETLREARPHIVLLDIIMPDMNGIEAMKAMKQIDPGIVVIMLTGVTDEKLAQKALQAGADDVITKPFDLNYLDMCLKAKMSQRPGSQRDDKIVQTV